MSKKLPITAAKNTKIAKTTKRSKLVTGRVPSFNDDFKNAALIVSVVINVLVFITWLVLRATDMYDDQVSSFFLNR